MTTPHTALIVIDVQEGFNDPAYWGPRNNAAAEDNISALIQAWEAAEEPVVVVQHGSRVPGSPLHPTSPGFALKPLMHGHGDVLITKEVNSVFYGDVDLRVWLAARGITRLVLCGIQTNMCVETTARMGGNLGYDVTVALDACHTFDLTGPLGTLTADEITRATVTSLVGGRFAKVEPTAQIVAGISVP